MSAAASFVRACPRCGEAILWCDGQPSPEVVVTDGRIIGCSRCMGARRRDRPAPAPVPLTPPQVNHRPVREIFASEAPKVVELVGQGLDLIEAGARFWDRLKPRRKT